MSIRSYFISTTTHPTWATKTDYTYLDFIVPSTPNNYSYECTTPGKSGVDEPTWPTTLGGTVTDGELIWNPNTEEWYYADSPAIWTCRTLLAPKPLEVMIDTEGFGGYSLKEIWVRSQREEGKDEFIVYGSFDGVNWRQIEELEAPHNDNKDNRHKGLHNAYRFIKVVVDSEYECEIEIVAGAN